VDGYSAAEPRPVSLGYIAEPDQGVATWVSFGDAGQPVVGRVLTGGPVRLDDRAPPLGGGDLLSGKAPVAAGATGPTGTDMSAEEADGVRSVRIRIRVPAEAYQVYINADTATHTILDATVDGTAIPGGQNVSHSAGWRWGFSYTAPPSAGIDVRIRAQGPGPLRIRVVSAAAGLPPGVGAPALTPAVSWPGWPDVAGQTFVVRTFEL
jgi:hypothetical protein